MTDYRRARYERSDIVRLMMGATNGGVSEGVAMRDVARMTRTPLHRLLADLQPLFLVA